MKTALLKIGGKILDRSDDLISTISQLTQLYEDDTLHKIIIIPGGGTTANFVREIYSEFKMTDSEAHWLAIFSMNFNGKILQYKFPHLDSTESLVKLKDITRCFTIFLPYKLLREEDLLPHSWNVTSDSITLYIAHKLGLSECFLIKDVDGIYDKENHLIELIKSKELMNLKVENYLAKIEHFNQPLKELSKPIDQYLPKLIEKYKNSCIILNGKSERMDIYNYFTRSKIKDLKYTKIVP